jgi:polyisoprenyl-teichoic acid--peptidoglycan teichoic acid transferase
MHQRSSGQARAKHERDRLLRLILLCVLGLVVCGGLIGAYFAAMEIYETARTAVLTLGVPSIEEPAALSRLPQAPPAITPPNIAAGERVNVLVMGIDRRPSEKCPCRTDTMIIASLDPKTGSASLVSIPRDLYVPIPGVGEARINQANWYGELYRVPGGGPALAKQTVEYNLGRKIHYYVLVDFSGFRKVIDTLGGVDIDVAKAIDDPLYPDDTFGIRPLHIPAGRIHMNGDMALSYARTRHVDNDFGRSKRQIQVMLAVRDKALQMDLLPKLPTLIAQFSSAFQTDITAQQVLALAPIAAKVKTENIKTGTIDQTMTVEFRTNEGADVLWPDRAKIGRMLDEVIPQDNVADAGKAFLREGARILILNGTKNAGVGEKTAKLLQSQGFQVAALGNADRTDYSKSVLIDYAGDKPSTIAQLATEFHISPDNIRRVENVKSDVEIRLILGSDWNPPP